MFLKYCCTVTNWVITKLNIFIVFLGIYSHFTFSNSFKIFIHKSIYLCLWLSYNFLILKWKEISKYFMKSLGNTVVKWILTEINQNIIFSISIFLRISISWSLHCYVAHEILSCILYVLLFFYVDNSLGVTEFLLLFLNITHHLI